MQQDGFVLERPPHVRIGNVLVPTDIELGLRRKRPPRVIPVEAPLLIEDQPVAPGGAPIVEAEPVPGAQRELRHGPDALMPSDVPPLLHTLVLEPFAQDDISVGTGTARTKRLGRNRRTAHGAAGSQHCRGEEDEAE
jgi:hypothetical protein